METVPLKNFKERVGDADLLLVTLDTLRYDAAQAAWREGRLATLGPYLDPEGWQRRHSPGNFTYAAHHAIFSGFLPTPAAPGPHPRLFAPHFPGSTTVSDETFVFDEATLPGALAARGYRTVCIGGTGFFNGQGELGSVFPRLFSEHHWSPELGVACRDAPANQVALAVECLDRDPSPCFLFINSSAMHQPNWFYGGAEGEDTLATHTQALVEVDRTLPLLFDRLGRDRPCLCIFCSDHGTAYGEDGYSGHRLGHEVVWEVPYLEFWL